MSADAGVLRSSSVMAVGTIASRVTGMLRNIVLVAAIGGQVFADTYTVANNLPNILYILLVGGALNAVFIPQLVRHMASDRDGGGAYADRLITLSGLVLLAVSALTVALAPFIVRLYSTNSWSSTDLAVSTAFARYCLPQIFFYGVYTLYSQVLNARGHFAMPMFTPILNNLVVIVVCGVFIAAVGPDPTTATITPGETALLGLGTTAGIVVQALALVPVMARYGYRYRPRFDLRGQGLGKAVTLAKWTIVLVAINQLAFVVVARLATSANAAAEAAGSTSGAGITVYTTAYLIFILPHSVVTVSVVTALLPRMSRAAAANDLRGVRDDVSRGIRLVSTAMVPSAIALVLLGPSIGLLLFSFGASGGGTGRYIGVVTAAFALGLVPFSIYYVLLRGFYAVEDTRTPALVAFFLNSVNLAAAYALYLALPPEQQVVGLALGYSAAYLATMVLLWQILRRRLGGLNTYLTVRTLVRLTVAGIPAGLAGWATLHLLQRVLPGGRLGALLLILGVSAVGGAVFVGVARRLRVAEVSELVDVVADRLGRSRR